MHPTSCFIKLTYPTKPNWDLSKSHLQRSRDDPNATTLQVSLLDVLECLEDLEKETLVAENVRMRLKNRTERKCVRRVSPFHSEMSEEKPTENLLADLTDIENFSI